MDTDSDRKCLLPNKTESIRLDASRWRQTKRRTRYKFHLAALFGFVLGFMVAFAMLLIYAKDIQLTKHVELRHSDTNYYDFGYQAAMRAIAKNSTIVACTESVIMSNEAYTIDRSVESVLLEGTESMIISNPTSKLVPNGAVTVIVPSEESGIVEGSESLIISNTVSNFVSSEESAIVEGRESTPSEIVPSDAAVIVSSSKSMIVSSADSMIVSSAESSTVDGTEIAPGSSMELVPSVESVIVTSTVSNSQPKEYSSLLLEPELRVLCMVLTYPDYHQERAVHVQATWGKRCTKLIFISSADDAELGAVALMEPDETYHDLWNKTREGFRYVYEQYYEEYDWFLKADDDTYVIMENLRFMLSAYDTEMALYFGNTLRRYEVDYMSGGAGYVLSREALRRFMTDAYSNDTICPRAHKYGIEDYYMGICLQNTGVFMADSRLTMAEIDEKPKLFPLSLASYMEPHTNTTIGQWLLDMTPYKLEVGLECCSNLSIAFHYTQPAMMYTYEFLLYHLEVYGLQKSQLRPSRRKVSAAQVEQRFKQNFNSDIVAEDNKMYDALIFK